MRTALRLAEEGGQDQANVQANNVRRRLLESPIIFRWKPTENPELSGDTNREPRIKYSSCQMTMPPPK